ncbi:TetR/AcrR family transcriptional regulator [Kitasatospora sp. NPDC088264]|uniref:TetR/AcrR family transcriptional regulator n=1 Tax=Kitasatospora sp. NPDC088264 TaxID=3155296 RepID=UPI003447FB0D
MPRLTDARKELRRTQITEAAVGCFSRDGLERTSIADITAESGLSTGSIYAHYRSKDDLVRASAHALLAKRAEALGQYAASDSPPDPDELLARLIATIDPAEARVGVQTWGEATTNPAIRAIVADTVDRMRAMVLDCVTAHPGQGRRPRPGPRDDRLTTAEKEELRSAAAVTVVTALRTSGAVRWTVLTGRVACWSSGVSR